MRALDQILSIPSVKFEHPRLWEEAVRELNAIRTQLAVASCQRGPDEQVEMLRLAMANWPPEFGRNFCLHLLGDQAQETDDLARRVAEIERRLGEVEARK